MADTCPGSHKPPHAAVPRERAIRMARVMVDSYGICPHCRREYYVLGNGTIHLHNAELAAGTIGRSTPPETETEAKNG